LAHLGRPVSERQSKCRYKPEESEANGNPHRRLAIKSKKFPYWSC
jgi:hypothetical protein